MIIVRDEESERLDLPKQYVDDDIPLIIQDRSFNEDGSFLDFPLRATHPRLGSHVGLVVFPFRKGDKFLVNGVIAPVLESPAQMVRFRILNASNNRFYNLGFSDNRTFYQIASDGGLLEGACLKRACAEVGCAVSLLTTVVLGGVRVLAECWYWALTQYLER